MMKYRKAFSRYCNKALGSTRQLRFQLLLQSLLHSNVIQGSRQSLSALIGQRCASCQKASEVCQKNNNFQRNGEIHCERRGDRHGRRSHYCNNTCRDFYNNIPSDTWLGICRRCFENIQSVPYSCRVCGGEMAAESQLHTCQRCIETPPAYERLLYYGRYDSVLSTLIIAAKIAKRVDAVAALQNLVRHQFQYYIQCHNLYHVRRDGALFVPRSAPFDITELSGYAVLPMPIPTARLMMRGFNLPALLAKTIVTTVNRSIERQINADSCAGKANGNSKEVVNSQKDNDMKPLIMRPLTILSPEAVTLPWWVAKQSRLSKKQRLSNRHYYRINRQLPEKVMIVDDVFTTGRTVDELAKKLRQNGVKSVVVYVVARG